MSHGGLQGTFGIVSEGGKCVIQHGLISVLLTRYVSMATAGKEPFICGSYMQRYIHLSSGTFANIDVSELKDP